MQSIDKRVKYLAFCFEVFKHERKLSGKQVYEIFNKYNLVDYIMDMYELLHIHGTRYLMSDLEDYISHCETGGRG